jgi:hypothetical protein
MVDTQHDEYTKWKEIWQRNKDCIDGQDAIKQMGRKYLSKLNGQDDFSYNSYLRRAQFINFSGRTVSIGLGQIFRKPPVIENIEDDIYNDIDLSGRSLSYFSRDIIKEVMITNRCGVLVDWSDYQSRPYLIQYSAFEIINWKEKIIDGKNKLYLVVLEGYVEVDGKDMYENDKEKIWKVLWLDDGKYTVSTYIKNNKPGGEKFVKKEEDKIPLVNGQALDFIPFYFITSSGIKNSIEKSVMYDFCNVNIGHYINSADYENMLHWTGAKTVVTKGFGDKKAVPIGGSFDLAVDGDAFFLEASSDSGLKEEMKRKEEQMAVMGATLISGQGRYVASAETSRINSQGEYASLEDLSTSLSVSMTTVMKFFIEWQGGDSKNVSVEYNTDFELAELDPGVLQAYMGAVQSGYMSWEVFYYNMKNKELYPPDWTIEDEKKAIEEGKGYIEEVEIDEDVDQNQDETEDN